MEYTKEQWIWILLRLSMGITFLWAFLDKAFGLGFATTAENAWINGGSPTYGFLTHGTSGPLASVYQAMAGHPVVNFLFMAGLLLIGLALLLGIGVKVAGWSGALMMVLMYSAAIPPENNPLLDDHIVYALVLIGLATVRAGRWLGLGEWWAKQPIVKKYNCLE